MYNSVVYVMTGAAIWWQTRKCQRRYLNGKYVPTLLFKYNVDIFLCFIFVTELIGNDLIAVLTITE